MRRNREVQSVSDTIYERVGPQSVAGFTRVERDNAAHIRKTYFELLDTAPE